MIPSRFPAGAFLDIMEAFASVVVPNTWLTTALLRLFGPLHYLKGITHSLG